jgi:hypothetical protein
VTARGAAAVASVNAARCSWSQLAGAAIGHAIADGGRLLLCPECVVAAVVTA